MNLIRLHIENFKQFVDPLEIEIPQQATIGVIGSNGVGKTTLFQAIEWCLYNPSTISGRDIRPRGRSGNPKVSLTLESRDGTQRWIVERELKRAATMASVYEIQDDASEKMIVQGTREVTDFVSNRLIDLSHKAFVATFFTRQKELHFFGDMRDTDRRREVGKLLGLETIRRAQIAIGEERTAAVREAHLLHRQFASETGERDLDAELTEVQAQVETAVADIERTTTAETAAITAMNDTRKKLDAAQQLREQHTDVANQLERARAAQGVATTRHLQRVEEIARLEDAKRQRESLLPVAANLESLQGQVQAAEIKRERFRQKTQLEQSLRANGAARESTIGNLAGEVHRVEGKNADSRWIWTDDDAQDVASAVTRLRTVSESRPADTIGKQRDGLVRAKAAFDTATTGMSKLETYIKVRNDLVAQRGIVIKDGDPAAAIRELEMTASKHNTALATWTADRRNLELDLSKRQRVLTNITNSNFDDGCPTCGRKFSEHDEHDVVGLFESDITALHQQIQAGDQSSREVQVTLKSLETRRQECLTRQEQVQALDKRIAGSVGFIEEQESTVERDLLAADQALAATGLTEPPADSDIEHAEKVLRLATLLEQAIGRIAIHAEAVSRLDDDRRVLEREYASLKDVTFDDLELKVLLEARDEANRASTQISGFDRELVQLPIAIEDRDTLTNNLREGEETIAEIRKQLFEIGFDPELLQTAIQAVSDAERAERLAIHERQQAELTHQRVVSRKENIEKEHGRIRSIVIRADKRQREADDMQQMYNLFGEFEQYVVARLTPALSELTSDLVRQVTDGRYDDVKFDDNFGVMVSDGDENPFALATFSGGERDAIALCARLALSQMIGLQAADQPGFLVLDEVFGSLDRERRSRLLELFGNLSTVSDRFQQVFIISHVDDVRTAPILDELWMVQESDDGKSTIVSLAPGTDVGEL